MASPFLKLFMAAISVACLLSGCGFFHDERLVGPYRLLAVDVAEEMAICEGASSGGCGWVVPPTVFAVGWDTSFIIAKQHPFALPRAKPDKSTTTFWIIRVADRTVVGPLSEPDFELTRIKLGVPIGLEFKKQFPDLAGTGPRYSSTGRDISATGADPRRSTLRYASSSRVIAR